jgi:hypothetical protein
VIAAFAAWAAFKYAFKRLVKEPMPPEKVKG